jgi:hypothetical protein
MYNSPQRKVVMLVSIPAAHKSNATFRNCAELKTSIGKIMIEWCSTNAFFHSYMTRYVDWVEIGLEQNWIREIRPDYMLKACLRIGPGPD